MQLEDIIVEVRDKSYRRVGQILVNDLSLSATVPFNNVGNWEITLPRTHAMTPALQTPGSGIVITGPGGAVLLSGPVTQPSYMATTEASEGVVTFSGVTDDVLLQDYLAWPQPANADATTQTTGSDTRTGAPETLLHEYVSANLGPSAPAERRHPYLGMGVDEGRGGAAITKSARFPVLGTLLNEIAGPARLGFKIRQGNSGLVFQTFQASDRSASVRLSSTNGLASQRATVLAPAVTRAIVGGAGSGSSRYMVEVSNSDSIQAELDWGRRIETFIDQRQMNGTDQLERSGNEALVEGGKTGIHVELTPAEHTSYRFGLDWGLGDLITCEVDGEEVVSMANGFAMRVSETDGFIFGVTLGEQIMASQTVEARLSNLERTAESSEKTGVMELFAGSTAPGGTLLCDGSAVSRNTYAKLFSVIGTTFGAGDGSTTFNLPDMRNSMAVGASSTKALGAKGGSETKTIQAANLPPHTHSVSTRDSATGFGTAPTVAVSNTGGTITTRTSGDGNFANTPLDVMNPYVALNYIIHI